MSQEEMKTHPFPHQRPTVTITLDKANSFVVNCPELRSWFIIPELGHRSLYANYDATDWKLSEVYDLTSVRSARIHNREGVEIDVHCWKPNTGWFPTWQMYGRLTKYQAEYLAVLQFNQEQRILYTYLDQHFDYDWGKMTRCLKDKGNFIIKDSRHTEWKDKSDEDGVAGFFSVQIGKRKFNCLRILGLDQDLLHPEVSITEEYIDESGRTIMVRRFCSMRKSMLDDQGQKRLVDLDKESLLKINGSTFYHWYDSFSNLAFGLKTETTE